jgi:hypothetical protein
MNIDIRQLDYLKDLIFYFMDIVIVTQHGQMKIT